MKILEKNYNHKEIEDKLYKDWEEKKYFTYKYDSKEKFNMVMPPPNVTGKLHMGHALNNTLQDIVVRYKRMNLYNVSWIPGFDHASIATEVKIIKELNKKNISKQDLGREKFLKKAFEWKDHYKEIIKSQLKKLGVSCDWSKETFTMDKNFSDAVNETFIYLYNKKYIYKDKKIINWCPKCKTSISDIEIEYIANKGYLYYIKYKFYNSDEYLVIATTRPETIFGDVAVAINKKDKRYKNLKGKEVIVPIINKRIPIIYDDYVDMDFGTGVVKITPAHDKNDFKIGEKHNLECINILNDDGTLNVNIKEYNNCTINECREKIVKELKSKDLLVKVKDYENNIGVHDRCKALVEPMIKDQWFVRMDKLKLKAIDAIKNKSLKFIPNNFEKIYLSWLNNIDDWCISRQLWWGHSIPVYYCLDCNEIIVSKEKVNKCTKCGSNNLKKEEDVLDTWFSSALSPIISFGWPKLDNFYPTDLLVTGYDIIFFWVIRMVVFGYELTDKCPFNTVLIHGLIKDYYGKKMSKSLSNGIDPIDVIDKYGADTLRKTLISGISLGNDAKFYYEKINSNKLFLNKLWNASKFLLMNIDKNTVLKEPIEYNLDEIDKYILFEFNSLIKDVTNNFEKYEFNICLLKLENFIWNKYCSLYIEFVKIKLLNKDKSIKEGTMATLYYILINSLKLLHPIIPFITDEIYRCIKNTDESIMISKWPKYNKKYEFKEKLIEIKDFIKALHKIRNLKNEINMPNNKNIKIYLIIKDDSIVDKYKFVFEKYKKLIFANEIIIQKDNKNIDKNSNFIILDHIQIYVSFNSTIDVNVEIKRIQKEKEKLIFEVSRSEKILSNIDFLSKAPADKINKEKEKYIKYKNDLEKIQKKLNILFK